MSTLNDNTQRLLRENNIISQEEIALEEGDLLIAENVLTKERRMLQRDVVSQFSFTSNISESKTKTKLLKG